MTSKETKELDQTEIVIGLDGTVLSLRDGATDVVLGQNLRAGERVQRCIQPDDLDIFELLLRATPQRSGREATLCVRCMRADGRPARVLAKFRAINGDTVMLKLQHDDIQMARRAEQQMRRVVEGSAQGIVVRTATQVLYMNQSFVRLLGYSSPRECIDSEPHIDSIIHPDDRQLVLDHLHARIAGREQVSHYDFRLQRRDRAVVWVETYAATVIWNGQPASLSWLSDISERKAMEAELVRRKEEAEFANRTKAEFLANMSHELRTPLNAILGFSEMMSARMFGPINAKYAEYAGDIHSSGEHLLDLVNDVLDLSKLEAGKLELRESEIALAGLIDESLKPMLHRAAAGKVRLKTEIVPDLPTLRADLRSVRQILLNLLSNAIKFTPEGGEVAVMAYCDASGRICMSVSDTGIGMSNTDIAVALSPFGQIDSGLKHQGTGLGLPICKSLMQMHGGELIVRSEPKRGTTISVSFPVNRTVAERRALACHG